MNSLIPGIGAGRRHDDHITCGGADSNRTSSFARNGINVRQGHWPRACDRHCRVAVKHNEKGAVMHHRSKILAPVDLGSEAEARVHHALHVAEALQGDLTLLYVVDGRRKLADPVEWPRNAMARHHNVD